MLYFKLLRKKPQKEFPKNKSLTNDDEASLLSFLCFIHLYSFWKSIAGLRLGFR